MRSIDINCDMGEGMPNDAELMPYISSANIACGFHAGDEDTMRRTIGLACKHGVTIGAHVSFADRENFGRSEMILTGNAVYDLVQQQLLLLQKIANEFAAIIRHIKPHGALYNMSAREEKLAHIIAKAVKDFDPSLIVFGLSGSHSIREAAILGLKTANEVFADRSYEDDGSLRSRSLPGALLQDAEAVSQQVVKLVNTGTVTSINGKDIFMQADTVCVHGDGEHAVGFAQNIYENMKKHSIEIKPC